MRFKTHLQFIVIALLFFVALYALPSFGHTLRVIYGRVITFITNIARSQEKGLTRQEVETVERALLACEAALNTSERENALLRDRLNLNPKDSLPKLLLADVIGQGSGFGNETLMINKGLGAGLKGGEVALASPNILIGVVHEVFNDRAIIRLMFDNAFSLPAKTEMGTIGVIKGAPGKTIIFDEVSQSEILEIDNLVLTHHTNPTIPADIPIGRVREILSTPADIFQRAQIAPLFDQRMIDRVFVVLEP